MQVVSSRDVMVINSYFFPHDEKFKLQSQAFFASENFVVTKLILNAYCRTFSNVSCFKSWRVSNSYFLSITWKRKKIDKGKKQVTMKQHFFLLKKTSVVTKIVAFLLSTSCAVAKCMSLMWKSSCRFFLTVRNHNHTKPNLN